MCRHLLLALVLVDNHMDGVAGGDRGHLGLEGAAGGAGESEAELKWQEH